MDFYLPIGLRTKYFFNYSILGYGVEFLDFLSYPFKNKQVPSTKFVVFSSGRAGSTLLVNLLDYHSQIDCQGEILRRKMLYPYAYTQRCCKSSKFPIFGFKLLSYQLRNVQTSIEDKQRFLQNLVAEGYQIIYLERKNIFRQALSVLYGYHRDQWHVKKGEQKTSDKMHIDPPMLREWMDNIEELKQYEKKLLETLPHIHITYEDCLSTPKQQRETIEILHEILQIPNEEFKNDLKRVTPKKLSDFISNADEVIGFLSLSKYHYFVKNSLDLSASSVGEE